MGALLEDRKISSLFASQRNLVNKDLIEIRILLERIKIHPTSA